MMLKAESVNPLQQNAQCLIVGLYEDGMTETAMALDQLTDGYLTKLIEKELFKPSLGQTLPLFHLPHTAFETILLVGAGKKQNLTASGFVKLVSAAMKAIHGLKIESAIATLSELEVQSKDFAFKAKQFAETAFNSFYRFDQYKTEKEPPTKLSTLILTCQHQDEISIAEKAIVEAKATADGMTFAKNLANLPSNHCTPSTLADAAVQLANTYDTISTETLDQATMETEGMGALLGVAKGSIQKPLLITLKYSPNNQNIKNKLKKIALVGKGVTFDTGGISLKPADSMYGMKYDMCGAATVLGVIKAAAELQLPIEIFGVIPAVENMPSGSAYKPEDILKSLSGQTIEVLNTDAEGRLILADALTYCERFHPDTVIDIATLTGAVVIALGSHASAVLGNNETLVQNLISAGEAVHDRAWALPLWDDYQETLKSPFADMANVGGRAAGTITAACFLSKFAKKFNWAHLDVAGTAANMSNSPDRAATGRPIPLLVKYLINEAQ